MTDAVDGHDEATVGDGIAALHRFADGMEGVLTAAAHRCRELVLPGKVDRRDHVRHIRAACNERRLLSIIPLKTLRASSYRS